MISDRWRARSTYLPYLGWGGLLFVVLLWRLGEPTFWDPDEAHYAQTTRELVSDGHGFAPFYNQQPFFDKPIFFHLVQATAMRLWGPTELAARLVSALAALVLILTTYWLGATLCSAEVGLVAGLMLTAGPAVLVLSRYAIVEALFTALLFGGAALVAVAALRGPSWLQYPGFALLGLATLTKGPVALILCGLALLIATACSAEARSRLRTVHWTAGLGIACGLAAPWFVYMWTRFGAAFVQGYVLNENLWLFLKPLYGGQPGWYHYVGLLALGLLPWTGLFVGRLYDDVRGVLAGRWPDMLEVLFWSWIAAIVGFFSVSRFKLDHYIFPAAPAACLLCARAWADLRSPRVASVTTGARVGRGLIGPMLALSGLWIGGFMISRLAVPSTALIGPIALVVGGAVLTHRVIYPRRFAHSSSPPWIALTAITVLYAALLHSVAPALEQGKVVPDVARWVARRASPAHRIAVYRMNRWSPAFRFYVERHVTHLETLEEAAQFFNDPSPFYCVLTEPEYDELVSRGAPLEIAYSREGMRATSGRILWRKRPLTRFLVVTRDLPTMNNVATAARPAG